MHAPADRLLTYLQQRLARPGLAYSAPPEPIRGGYDTLIYGFTLAGAPAEFSSPLILRVFRDDDGHHRAAAEAVIQNAVVAAGYPAPCVLLVCDDASVLGGAFTIMPRVSGITLLAALGPSPILLRAGPLLAQAHARLHALDSAPIVAALTSAGVPIRSVGSDAWLEELGAVVDAYQLDGARSGFEWLRSHRPPAPARPSLLHLDFHPANVLVERGGVTGVIDWGNFALGDPAADVATTLMILTAGPLDVSPWVRPLFNGLRAFVARRYLATYKHDRPLPAASLRYYDAAKCFATMIHAAQIRVGRRRGEPVRETYAWSGEREVRTITARFKKLTGVGLDLPG